MLAFNKKSHAKVMLGHDNACHFTLSDIPRNQGVMDSKEPTDLPVTRKEVSNEENSFNEKFKHKNTTHKASNLRKLLIVEDNPMIQIINQRLFTDLGFHVVCENSGDEALAHYTPDYDAVLMDLQMPGSNGIETTIKLRDKFKSDHTPIYACTSLDESVWPQCQQAGMNGYIQKPCSKEAIKAFMQSILERDNMHQPEIAGDK